MFTIGEFSKLGRISPRMLRYYDAMDYCVPNGSVQKMDTVIIAQSSLKR